MLHNTAQMLNMVLIVFKVQNKDTRTIALQKWLILQIHELYLFMIIENI